MSKEGLEDKEIRKALFNKKYPITYLSFGEWDSLHIVRSVLSESRRNYLS